jgi:hypothetical protein
MTVLENLGVHTVIPGHGPVFSDFGARLSDLKRHHRRRLLSVWMNLENPMMASQLSQKVFNPSSYIHIRRLALAETLAYLRFMEANGLIDRSVRNAEHTYRRGQARKEQLIEDSL